MRSIAVPAHGNLTASAERHLACQAHDGREAALEGINDIGGDHSTDSVIAGYQNVVGRLHAKGIKVFAGTLTSALGISGVDMGDNGPGHEDSRNVLNSFIRDSRIFDGVEDFDAATLDPASGNMKEEFLPNSQFTELPWDYLHPNHAGYNAMGLAVGLEPFAPQRGSE